MTRRSSSRGSTGSSSRRSSNSRMWSQPATPRQRAALKANGNDDGKYYSKGRAGQTIGESVRSAGTSKPRPSGRGRAGRSPLPAPAPPVAGVVAISAVESAPLTASTGTQELPAPPVGMLSTSCGPTAVGRSGSTRWAGCGPNMSASPTRWTPVTSGLRSPLCVGEYRQGESPRYRVDQSRETSEIGGGVLGA